MPPATVTLRAPSRRSSQGLALPANYLFSLALVCGATFPTIFSATCHVLFAEVSAEARSSREAIPDTWSQCYARGAEASSCKTSGEIGINPRLVAERVERVFELQEGAAVYDLTVADQPEFVAGGVLIHNCAMAFSRRATGGPKIDVDSHQGESITGPTG
jgi:hypothetical protein